MLSATVFIPLAAALIIAAFLNQPRAIRYTAAIATIVDLALSLALFARFDLTQGGQPQFIERVHGWIPALNVDYFLAVDGLSLPLVVLTTILGFSAVYASWNIQARVKEYFVWLLVLQTAVLGVFTALDFLLFFVFWELELIPMYLLISIWGSGRKEYSAMKFVIFTLLGSAFMLIGILVLYFSTGTFDMTALSSSTFPKLLIPAQLVFFLFFLAYAIKLPVWPLHTWLPDAHTDAPTAVSVMLAGVLLKMGGYAMIRINVGMFPQVVGDFAWLLAVLAVVNVLYGAIVTLRQTDLKKLVAYSSISHMGYVLLGVSSVGAAAGALSPVGLTGASLQMFTHGTITGLLFALVGLLYDKAHTRHIPDLGGLATRMPFLAVILVLAGLASLGLPSLSGFVAEVLVFLGTFPVWSWATALGAFGIVLTAGYILWAIQRILFGPQNEHFAQIRDASRLEAVPLIALTIPIILIGIYPSLITDVFTAGILPILGRLN